MECLKLSRDSQEQRAQLLTELAQELRQLKGLSASFVRAAAARMGVTVTDMQVIESLTSSGPMTAGQLADLTGLTTGAITGMLNRLEEAGLVRRERDPEDGRRVIVRINPDTDQIRGIAPSFDSIGKALEEQISRYNDEQVAFLVEFLKRSNAAARQEILWLREAPQNEEDSYSAPLGDLASGRLVVASGLTQLTVRADVGMTELYQGRFEGSVPDVKAKDGVVTVRYPRRLWVLSGGQGTAEITLNAALPWWIVIQGGVSGITAELGGLNLAGLEVKGGMSMVTLELPAPSGVVPVRISGSASQITVHRPAGVPAPTSRAGPPNSFSTIKRSAIWATMCGCKAQAMKRLTSATTSTSPAASAWSRSPLIDDTSAPHRAPAITPGVITHARCLPSPPVAHGSPRRESRATSPPARRSAPAACDPARRPAHRPAGTRSAAGSAPPGRDSDSSPLARPGTLRLGPGAWRSPRAPAAA
jgi:DNA-binding MarR family transcriptional regulator